MESKTSRNAIMLATDLNIINPHLSKAWFFFNSKKDFQFHFLFGIRGLRVLNCVSVLIPSHCLAFTSSYMSQ